MFEKLFAFLERHQSFILTTHDPADADGLGAEIVFACVLQRMGKQFRIINAGPIPETFEFMDPARIVEQWDEAKHGALPERSALVMLDTADEYLIGGIKGITGRVKEVFVIDHHEPNPHAVLPGIIDRAASTCELLVEIAEAAGAELNEECASAAYAGIVYDTGFFAYSKTSIRTFRAALKLVSLGVAPYRIYQELNENASIAALLLQKKALSGMTIHNYGKVAAQVLRKEDLEATGARFEDAETFVNVPLKAREIAVSVLVKEMPDGNVRCSLRSKGWVNVSQIARDFGGGGHVSAAGFRSSLGVEETLKQVLTKTAEYVNRA
ncbi:MAG: bifunctional oligoribonuclease/PAP phosphatase NrnA [Treponema sp.]|jgi:phosphoesterase RecJ-like protein|nr:bifunctional oligoribonuclease/PAP phosphatase NrnA [Treponema sp.]